MARGGARVGAGRKPKALVYASEVAAAEKTLVDALPKLIEKLMALAMEGNVAALKYSIDRILGRVAVLKAPPATDTAFQYVKSDFESDLVDHLIRGLHRKEFQDVRMAGMDLEGTELEYEFDDEEEDEEEPTGWPAGHGGIGSADVGGRLGDVNVTSGAPERHIGVLPPSGRILAYGPQREQSRAPAVADR